MSAKLHTSWQSRLIAAVCGLLLVSTFAAYFGLLIWAIFAIFGLLDRGLVGQWDVPHLLSALVATLLVWLAVRVAARLALSILGLVTQKLDNSHWLDQQTVILDPESQWAGVIDRVCQRLEIKRPDELRLSCDQRCYVIEQRSFALQTQRRRILVMGMPQMLTMTVGEVQVILAHELAHFRSGDTTLTVFLFRLAETARVNAERLSQKRLWAIDPVYWYFNGFHHLFQWISAPWRRSHELLADQASAAAFGGELAAHTLLKDWFVELNFDESLSVYLEKYADDSSGELSVYEHFMEQWQDFTPESHDYLEKRLDELEKPSLLEAQPTLRQRLDTMRAYPDITPVDTRQALDLILEDHLLKAERELSAKLVTSMTTVDGGSGIS